MMFHSGLEEISNNFFLQIEKDYVSFIDIKYLLKSRKFIDE